MPAISVDRANIQLYAFMVSKDDSEMFTLTVTWKVPQPGGYSYVDQTVFEGVAVEDLAPVVFADMSDASDDLITAAGFTLTGTWPIYPEL